MGSMAFSFRLGLRAAAVAVTGLAFAAAARADVAAPRITTDGSVDTHDAASIVADVCRPGMSDEQKAIAIYEFVRRVLFHYEQRAEKNDAGYDLDAIRLINTYGYSFCTQQMLVLVTLWRQAGIDSQFWGVPGHSTAQASYGGKEHWFDPLIGGFAFSPKDKTVASLQEIAADPTVLTRAAAEGRASPTFMPCGDVLAADAIRLTTSAEYARACAALKDDVTYMATHAGAGQPMGGPRPSLFEPDWTLRPGEKVTFLWDCIDGEFNIKADPIVKELPPNHFCGVVADQKDKANWRFWKPYPKEINGVTTCRYFANGRQSFAPRFTNEYHKRGFEANSYGWFGFGGNAAPHLRPKQAGTPAGIVYKMSTPFVYTSAEVTAEFHRATADDVSRLFVSIDAGATWNKIWDAADAPGTRGPGKVEARASLKDLVRGQRDFWVRAESATGGDLARAGLHAIGVDAVFQHNMFARPFLVPGRNEVTVRTANPETLAHDAFSVTWAWQEAGRERQDARRITQSPTNYAIEVGGTEMPRMLRLEMAVAP